LLFVVTIPTGGPGNSGPVGRLESRVAEFARPAGRSGKKVDKKTNPHIHGSTAVG